MSRWGKFLRGAADVATLGGYELIREPTQRKIKNLVSDAGHGLHEFYNDITHKTEANAALDAAHLQADAANKALEENKRQFDISQQNLQPWLQTGTRALGALEGDLNSGRYNMPDYQAQTYDPGAGFSFNYSDLQNDPGYQFQLQQGTRALDQGAAARGGALGGNQARALTAYGQGLGAQSYGDAYARALQGYQTNTANRQNAFNINEGNRFGAYQQNANNRQQQFGRYSQLAGIGQQTGGQLAQIGSNYANQQANAYGNVADAQAGGIIGAANARAAGSGALLNLGLKTLPLLLA